VKKSRRGFVIVAAIVVILGGAGGIGYNYWYQGRHYVTTNNASVFAPTTEIVSPAAGELVGFDAAVGEKVAKGEKIGTVLDPGAGDRPVTATRRGTIGELISSNNSMVGAGSPVAVVVDTNDLSITANVSESEISEVKIGQRAQITLAAYPGVTFEGRVSSISPATASTFSLLPEENTNTNFTPVTQVVPVEIAFSKRPSRPIRAGESATVTIDIR